MMWLHADLLLRVLVGTMLGATIGYERRLHRRPAGLRTHLLVSLAASTFMVVSTHFASRASPPRRDSGSARRSGSQPGRGCMW
jgi:uncharacterized membrane protein YhiD involved in acid resistance